MAYKYQKEALILQYSCRCMVCERLLKYEEMEAHHIVPKKDGGSNAIDNLAIVCRPCHLRIHSHIYGTKPYDNYTKAIRANMKKYSR